MSLNKNHPLRKSFNKKQNISEKYLIKEGLSIDTRDLKITTVGIFNDEPIDTRIEAVDVNDPFIRDMLSRIAAQRGILVVHRKSQEVKDEPT